MKIKNSRSLQMLIISCIFGLLVILKWLGIYFFTTGFLMMRQQLPNISKLNPVTNNELWFHNQTSKVIFIIIDAMNFEFVYNNNTNNTDHHLDSPFQNKLTIFQDLLQQQPLNSFLIKCHSDPPTVTHLRIKSMTSGNLPSFMDVKNNFNSDQLEEDNIILQIKKANKTSVFMGDDTWAKIFPNAFSIAYPFDSFNNRDLHTVDNGVLEHIFPILQGKNWNFLVAHFLGVDHVGHTYNKYHPEMTKKLLQMNDAIQKVIQKMDNDTVLIVLGDHGQTEDGNHGGGTYDETTSAIFGYTKTGFLRNKFDQFNSLYYSDNKYETKVNQINLVPTIASLLGIPIPFNNLGYILTDFYTISGNTQVNNEIQFTKLVLNNIRINLVQLRQYVKQIHSQFNKFSEDLFLKFEKQFDIFDYQIGKLLQETNTLTQSEYTNQSVDLYIKIKQFFEKIRNECYLEFLEFDTTLMHLSIIFFIISGIFLTIVSFVFFKQFCKGNTIIELQKIINMTKNYQFIYGSIFLLLATANIFDIIKWTNCMCVILICFVFFLIQTGLKYILHTKQLYNVQSNIDLFEPWVSNYYSSALYILLILGKGIIVVSVYCLRLEDFFNELILYTFGIFDIIYIIYQKKYPDLFKVIVFWIIQIMCMFLAGLYDPYLYKSDDKSRQLGFISYVLIALNIIVITAIHHKQALDLFRLDKFASKYCFYTFYHDIAVAYVYHYGAQLLPIEEFPYLYVYVPRIVYFNTIARFILHLFNRGIHTQYKITLLALSLIPYFYLNSCQGSPLIIGFMIIQIYFNNSLHKILKIEHHLRNIGITATIAAIYFFKLGHRNQIASLQVQSAFVGFSEFNPYTSIPLVFTNTFASQLIVPFLIAALMQNNLRTTQISSNSDKEISAKKDQVEEYGKTIIKLYVYETVFFVTYVFGAFNCDYNRRHLLLTMDFAPKYLFDLVAYVISSLICVFLSFLRQFNSIQ